MYNVLGIDNLKMQSVKYTVIVSDKCIFSQSEIYIIHTRPDLLGRQDAETHLVYFSLRYSLKESSIRILIKNSLYEYW